MDQEVENTLLKNALGFEYEETITEVYTDPAGVERKHIRKIKKYSPPNTTAQIFWLKNRRPDIWREKHDVAMNVSANDDEIMAEIRKRMEQSEA